MTPLILVVGFLGSGKTTFLKNLMPALGLAEIRPTLLINDYQNARVDAAQFQNLTEEVKALSGDCVCCGSRDELFSFLQEFKHSPGRVMIVETNGTTDSAGSCGQDLALPGKLLSKLIQRKSLAACRPRPVATEAKRSPMTWTAAG